MKPLLSLSALAFTLIAADTFADGRRVPHDTHQTGGARMRMTGTIDPAMMQQMMKDMMPSPSDARSTRDFKKAHMAMMHNMHIGFTGDADVDFRRQMIPHHQGAIDMARAALRHAKDPATKKLARTIIAAQRKEIAEMRQWLKEHGR
jgi:uncharacterized protein (DUF305 family)